MDAAFTLVLATRNPGKVAEMQALLAELPVQLLTVDDLDAAPEVDEDEPTLEGNAVKKARALHQHSGIPALADDTGLEVEVLDGRPGVHSARYAGPEADEVANRALLLRELDGQANRTARFRTVIAFIEGDVVRTFEGICEGRILDAERGTGGFGYDALFAPANETRTFAELPTDEKNAISHRGRALRAFARYLTERFK